MCAKLAPIREKFVWMTLVWAHRSHCDKTTYKPGKVPKKDPIFTARDKCRIYSTVREATVVHKYHLTYCSEPLVPGSNSGSSRVTTF